MIRDMFRSFGLRRRVAEQRPKMEFLSDFPLPQGAEPLAVIGDVHGMLRPFEQMLARLAHEAPQAKIVCVGDLIDRGEQSAEVLRLAFDRRETLIVLLGNHEEMLLCFLDEPEQEGPRWLRNGGLQTLASFGISPPNRADGSQKYHAVQERLRAALGSEMEAWIRLLPRYYLTGNIAVTHAGADPWLPISQQSASALTWGHPEFGRRRRTDGVWVAHGHVIAKAPSASRGVISVDTGAYAGGQLTSALISQGDVRFLAETP